jgi:hypothetical protein
MSKSPVMGRQVVIGFSPDGGKTQVTLCELESFSYKIEDEVKENSVLGEAGVGSFDVLHMKVTCSCETKHRDSALLAYFVNQQKQSRAGTGGDIVGTAGVRGRVPYFTITKTVTYTDGSVMKVQLNDGVLHGFEEAVGSNNDEETQKFEGSFTRINVILGIGEASGGIASFILKDGVGQMGRTTALDEGSISPKLFATELLGS